MIIHEKHGELSSINYPQLKFDLSLETPQYNITGNENTHFTTDLIERPRKIIFSIQCGLPKPRPNALQEVEMTAEELDLEMCNSTSALFNIEFYIKYIPKKYDHKMYWNLQQHEPHGTVLNKLSNTKAFGAILKVSLKRPLSFLPTLSASQAQPQSQLISADGSPSPHVAPSSTTTTTLNNNNTNNLIFKEFYDAIFLYAMAFNETLLTHGSINFNNGTQIRNRMSVTTFQGKIGNVHFDKNGDRNADYFLLSTNSNKKKSRVVAHYSGKYKLVEKEIAILPRGKVDPESGTDTDCEWGVASSDTDSCDCCEITGSDGVRAKFNVNFSSRIRTFSFEGYKCTGRQRCRCSFVTKIFVAILCIFLGSAFMSLVVYLIIQPRLYNLIP